MYLVYYWTTLVAMLILYKVLHFIHDFFYKICALKFSQGIHKAAKKLEQRGKAKEHRHIALLLTQRLGTQVIINKPRYSLSLSNDAFSINTASHGAEFAAER